MSHRLLLLQRFILRKRQRRKPVHYKEIAEQLRERYSDDSYLFTPGQLALIEKGRWDPEPSHIRRAYRLGPRTCPTCHQKIRTPRNPRPAIQLTDAQVWWRSLHSEQRNFYIESIYQNDGVV